jgi:hypothetical protein
MGGEALRVDETSSSIFLRVQINWLPYAGTFLLENKFESVFWEIVNTFSWILLRVT